MSNIKLKSLLPEGLFSKPSFSRTERVHAEMIRQMSVKAALPPQLPLRLPVGPLLGTMLAEIKFGSLKTEVDPDPE